MIIKCNKCKKTLNLHWYHRLIELVTNKKNFTFQDFNTALSLFDQGNDILTKYHILKEHATKQMLDKTIVLAGNNILFSLYIRIKVFKKICIISGPQITAIRTCNESCWILRCCIWIWWNFGTVNCLWTTCWRAPICWIWWRIAKS